MVQRESSVIDAVEYFLQYKHIRKGSPRTTIVSYKSILYQLERIAKVDSLDDMTAEIIEHYCFTISLSGLASKTVHNKIAVVRSFVRFLYGKNLTDIRPESIDIPKSEPVDRVFLTSNEQLRLINATISDRDRAMIILLISSGMRVSELSNLIIDDINGRCIRIRNGKGYKPRLTFITQEARETLDLYLSHRIEKSAFVFCNKFGGRLSRQSVAKIVSRCAYRAGIKKQVTPHTLRRTFATNLLQAGMRIEELQPIMGHSSILTTRSYTELANNYLQEVYDRASLNIPSILY